MPAYVRHDKAAGGPVPRFTEALSLAPIMSAIARQTPMQLIKSRAHEGLG
jgi:hypothetical protein